MKAGDWIFEGMNLGVRLDYTCMLLLSLRIWRARNVILHNNSKLSVFNLFHLVISSVLTNDRIKISNGISWVNRQDSWFYVRRGSIMYAILALLMKNEINTIECAEGMNNDVIDPIRCLQYHCSYSSVVIWCQYIS